MAGSADTSSFSSCSYNEWLEAIVAFGFSNQHTIPSTTSTSSLGEKDPTDLTNLHYLLMIPSVTNLLSTSSCSDEEVRRDLKKVFRLITSLPTTLFCFVLLCSFPLTISFCFAVWTFIVWQQTCIGSGGKTDICGIG